MADRYELAFLRNALSASGVEEETALVNLLFQRLLAGNFTINSSGTVSFSFSGLFGDGAVGAPAISFLSDTDTGFYRSGANTMVAVTGGSPRLTIDASGVTTTGSYLTSASSGGLAFDGTGTRLKGPDGGQYLIEINGGILVNAASLQMANGGTKFIFASPTVDGQQVITDGGGTHGVGLDLTSDGTLKLRSRVFGAATLDVSAVTGMTTPLTSAQGGTGSAFFAISGPSVLRTFALPDASATVLTSNAAVTVAQGGTGVATLTNHGVLLGQAAGNLAATSAGATGTILAGNTSADPTFQTASAVGASMVLLKANSGTDTAAGATNVDTIAISGLTAKDTLLVYYSAISVTQQTADLSLYSVTDSQLLAGTMCGVIAAAEVVSFDCKVMQSQASSTSYWTFKVGGGTVAGAKGPLPVISPAMTTAFTGSWTLALRHGGVTAGGTLQWKWAVYAVKGQ